jgi:hypothetical protein
MAFEEGKFYTLNEVVDIARCQQERIKVLEQRVIDLQGHDDLSYIEQQMCSLYYATAAVNQLLENTEG